MSKGLPVHLRALDGLVTSVDDIPGRRTPTSSDHDAMTGSASITAPSNRGLSMAGRADASISPSPAIGMAGGKSQSRTPFDRGLRRPRGMRLASSRRHPCASMFDNATLLDALQWPAMAVTVVASWLVGSTKSPRRKLGFWIFLASNALWIAWGCHAAAWALVVLQVCLATMNIRGCAKAAPSSDGP